MINNIDTKFYNFDSPEIFGQSLIHLINLYLPKDSVIVEIGTGQAQTSCLIAQKCSNIKTIYTIDQYIPYENINGPAPIGEKEIDYMKIVAKHNIEFSGIKEKIKLLEMDCMASLQTFDDNSLDLIFYDINLDYETTIKHLSGWYKKLKPNGIFSGHCWDVLESPVLNFKNSINNNNLLSVYNNVWAWLK
jgi:predicted O-methyltransferase YrrM